MGYFADHAADGQIVKFGLYRLDLVWPAVAGAPQGSGALTITPAAMDGVVNGAVLAVADTFETHVATAPSPALSGTSLTVTASHGAKLPPVPFYMTVKSVAASPVAPFTEILQVTNIAGDVLTIVRGTGPRAIIIGDALTMCLSTGLPTSESVTASGVTLTTFDATFVNKHAYGWEFVAPHPVYWTDSDIDIDTGAGDVCGAHTWVAQPIIPGAVSNQPDGQSASFSIADADGVVLLMLSTQNGGEMAPAALYAAGFLTTNKTPLPDEVLTIFTGLVDRATSDTSTTDSIEFVLMPPVMKDAGMLPTRLISTLIRS